MKNDAIRIQDTILKLTGRPTTGRPTRLDGSELRLQSSTSDETYSDGFVDYTQEI